MAKNKNYLTGKEIRAIAKENAKVMKRHAYPLYNADVAKVCMAAYLMIRIGE